MKRAWTEIKSFVTVFVMLILATIVVGNLFGLKLDDPVLLLFTNISTAVITFYFAKKDDEKKGDDQNG